MAGYTPNANSVIHSVKASLDRRGVPDIVHLVQYDRTLPILAVELTYGDQPFAVPATAEVNIRLRKPDGTHVYDPALGTSADRRTVYIGVTAQMTTAAGRVGAILEILEGGGVVGTAPILFDVDVNPVPEDAIESTDEFLTVQDLAAQAAASAAAAKASETEAGRSKTAAADSASQAEGSAGEAAGSAAEARRQAEAAQDSAKAAGESERNAAQSAETAKQYSGNPPEIDENGFWETWDAGAQKYTSTGEKAVNHWDTTYKTVAEMQADKTQPKNTVCIISSDVEQEENAQVYMWDGAKWNFLCDLSGLQGVGIAKIELTAGDHTPGTDDTYTVTLTDRRTYTFTVHNGSESVTSVNGQTGDVEVQNVLTGTPGQVVGFDRDGNAVAGEISGRNYILKSGVPRETLSPGAYGTADVTPFQDGPWTFSCDYEIELTAGGVQWAFEGNYLAVMPKLYPKDNGKGHLVNRLPSLYNAREGRYPNHRLYLAQDAGTAGTIKFSNMKLEPGIAATGWSPAPEDLLPADGTAKTAEKLAAPRSLKTDLGSTTAVTFDGSADQNSIPVTGILPPKNGGTGYNSNAKAIEGYVNANTNTVMMRVRPTNQDEVYPLEISRRASDGVYHVDAGGSTSAEIYTSRHPQPSVTGNAGTATQLKTARNINGVSFDGSKDISIGNLREIKVTNVDFRTYMDAVDNTHHGFAEEINAFRFFISDNTPPADYHLPCVDSHIIVGSIDNDVRFIRFLALDIRTNDVYTCTKTSAGWGNWEKIAKTTDKPAAAGTADKVAHALKFTGGSSVAFNGSADQTVAIPTELPAKGGTAANVSGVVSVEHGGTGVTTADGLRDLVNTYPRVTGTEGTAVIDLAKQAYQATADNTTRTVPLSHGSQDFVQIFRTNANYGQMVLYSDYGEKIYLIAVRQGSYSELKCIYPIEKVGYADTAGNANAVGGAALSSLLKTVLNFSNGQNADDFTTGFALGANVVNAPDSAFWGFITIRLTDTGCQIAVPLSSALPGIRFRVFAVGHWNAWRTE